MTGSVRQNFEPATRSLDEATAILAAQAEVGESFSDPLGRTPANQRDLAVLQLGFANEKIGDTDKARDAYRSVLNTSKGSEQFWDKLLVFHAHSQLGTLDIVQARWGEAATSFREAVELEQVLPDAASGLDLAYWEELFQFGQNGLLRGAQENNLALAEAKQGNTAEAVAAAEAALRRDARNPVYLDTLAFVHHLGGDDKAAAAAYADALKIDPTSYVSANNLAVVLADGGNDSDAELLLNAALDAKPDYATAWHNLGVLRSSDWTVSGLLTSQGALAKAARLDRTYIGAGTGLQVDDTIYNSGLDVAQPMLADWSYAESASTPARSITLTMIILLLLRMVRVLGVDQVTSRIGERLVAWSPSRPSRQSWFWKRLRVRWGMAISLVVIAWGVLFVPPNASSAMFLVVASSLVVVPLLVRMTVADQRREPLQHFTWTPAVAVAAVGTPFGFGFAPFPSIDVANQAPSRSVRWVVPTLAGMTALVFIALTAATSTPLTRDISAAAVLMSASILTPVPPMDGGSLSGRLINLAVTIALGVAAVAFALRWL